MNILFQGFFRKIAAVFRPKDRRAVEHHAPTMPKPTIPEPVEPRRGFAKRLLIPNDNPRNIIPGGKEMMLGFAEEKRERRRARNRHLAGITEGK